MLNPILHKRIRYISIRATALRCRKTDFRCRFANIAFFIALLSGLGGYEGGFMGGYEVGFPGWVYDG